MDLSQHENFGRLVSDKWGLVPKSEQQIMNQMTWIIIFIGIVSI